MHIPIQDLRVGHLYTLQCRNLACGVWNGSTFIGIRTKFGKVFLDTEDHWDNGPPYGTVHPLEDLGAVPSELVLQAHLGTVCHATGRPIRWVEGTPGVWVYEDNGLPMPEYPLSYAYCPQNKALFEYLRGYNHAA